MLFSSVNHIWVLLLFIYLGLVSGLIFFISCFLVNRVKFFLLKPKENSKKNWVKKQKKRNKHKKKLGKKSKEKNSKNIKKPFAIFAKSVLNCIKKFKNILVMFLCNSIKIIVLFCVVIASLFINLQLNFGHLTLGFVFVFVSFFFIAKRLLNLVAIYLLNFYNYFVRKVKRRGK